jgi:hypothetical protein
VNGIRGDSKVANARADGEVSARSPSSPSSELQPTAVRTARKSQNVLFTSGDDSRVDPG